MDKFNLKMLNEAEVKQHHQVKNSNRFAALETLDFNDVDIN
jgi:hypothetical protein